MKEVALKMLEYGPDECSLKHYLYCQYTTPLYYARKNDMKEVVSKITELSE